MDHYVDLLDTLKHTIKCAIVHSFKITIFHTRLFVLLVTTHNVHYDDDDFVVVDDERRRDLETTQECANGFSIQHT